LNFCKSKTVIKVFCCNAQVKRYYAGALFCVYVCRQSIHLLSRAHNKSEGGEYLTKVHSPKSLLLVISIVSLRTKAVQYQCIINTYCHLSTILSYQEKYFKGEHMIKGALVGTCSSDFVQTILRVRYSLPHFYYEFLLLSINSMHSVNPD